MANRDERADNFGGATWTLYTSLIQNLTKRENLCKHQYIIRYQIETFKTQETNLKTKIRERDQTYKFSQKKKEQ